MTSDQHGNMTGPSEHFDLASEIAGLRQQKPSFTGVCSKTLFKNAGQRIVLLALSAGGELPEHHVDGTLSVHVLHGAIHFKTGGKEYALPAGHLFTLAPTIPHAVRASEDAVFLLTLSWPSDPELRSLPHRGYGT